MADSLGLSPEDYVNALLERAMPRRRVDLMPLGFKVKVAEAVVEAALETFRRPLVVWSGGVKIVQWFFTWLGAWLIGLVRALTWSS